MWMNNVENVTYKRWNMKFYKFERFSRKSGKWKWRLERIIETVVEIMRNENGNRIILLGVEVRSDH